MDELVMYIIVNKDLAMSRGKTAAQASHSCTEYIVYVLSEGTEQEKATFNSWYNDCQKKIVLGAHQNVMEKLEKDERFFPIRDAGYTEIPENSLTAVCLGVHTKDEVRDITKRLQLLQ